MKTNNLLEFAKGKSPKEKVLNCTLTRVGNDVEITGCRLGDAEKGFIIKVCKTKEDVEFFRANDFSHRIEVCRQKLLKMDINTITLDEDDFGI